MTMLLRKPDYFDDFRCLASACPDSCCQEWDVQVDPASAAYYRSLPSALGDRLRAVLKEEDGEVIMSIEDGRCPLWRSDGLCRIQAELGEGALCATCRDFPRLTHDYGDRLERGLELSCPEAARWILNAPPQWTEAVLPGGEAPEYDREAMEVLLRTREEMALLLADESHGVAEALAIALVYGYHAQGELDGLELAPFDRDAALAEAHALAAEPNAAAFLSFFTTLEQLTGRWPQLLASPSPVSWEFRHRNLARYFVDRYWLQAVSDYDLVSRVKLMVISCLAVRLLGGGLEQTAQLYSKEMENSAENLDAILDGAYEAPEFADNKLLGLLLK